MKKSRTDSCIRQEACQIPKHHQYIQVHQDDAISNIKLQLFSQIASQPAFNQLRTVEQLGYIAGLSLRYNAFRRKLYNLFSLIIYNPIFL
jgi:insulysin